MKVSDKEIEAATNAVVKQLNVCLAVHCDSISGRQRIEARQYAIAALQAAAAVREEDDE